MVTGTPAWPQPGAPQVQDAPEAVQHAGARHAPWRVRLIFWAAVMAFLAGAGVGTAWDRRWHLTHPFDDFWSPPHLFIYTCVALTLGIVLGMMRSAGARRWFGADERLLLLPRAPLALPAPLLFLAGGLAAVILAGGFDFVWHTAFGLDETNWSLPHAMLGRGIMVTFWAFAACRLALTPGRSLPWFTALFLAWLIVGTVENLIGGPILSNPPPDASRAIAAFPVLANDPAVQHTFRIFEAWQLYRTHPLYLPMAAFTAGFGLALACGVTQRDRAMLGAALIVGLSPLLSGGPGGLGRLWLPLPYLPAALVAALATRLGASGRWRWLLAGWACCFWALVWVPRPGLALLAGPLALAGAALAERVAGIVRRPEPRPVLLLVGVVAGLLPVLTGAVDLWLRLNTP